MIFNKDKIRKGDNVLLYDEYGIKDTKVVYRVLKVIKLTHIKPRTKKTKVKYHYAIENTMDYKVSFKNANEIVKISESKETMELLNKVQNLEWQLEMVENRKKEKDSSYNEIALQNRQLRQQVENYKVRNKELKEKVGNGE